MFHTGRRHRYAADRIIPVDTNAIKLLYAQDDPSLLESDPFV
jgi:hypothetical protein